MYFLCHAGCLYITSSKSFFVQGSSGREKEESFNEEVFLKMREKARKNGDTDNIKID